MRVVTSMRLQYSTAFSLWISKNKIKLSSLHSSIQKGSSILAMLKDKLQMLYGDCLAQRDRAVIEQWVCDIVNFIVDNCHDLLTPVYISDTWQNAYRNTAVPKIRRARKSW